MLPKKENSKNQKNTLQTKKQNKTRKTYIVLVCKTFKDLQKIMI